jgi:4-amino-4-deoxy-L-arabinose transferase-like glycosyltransferase
MRAGIKYLLLLVLFLTGFLWLARKSVSTGVFGYDESDYAFDARLGWTANYTDTPTLPITDFLREGLGRGKSANQREALSESIRKSNDVIFYRHWHGPLYFYWLIPAAALTHSEHALRTLSLFIPIVSFIVISFGCLWLVGGWEGWLSAVLCSALFLWSWTTLGSTELAPHQLFACCCLLALFLVAKMAATSARLYLYGATVAAGLAFCTLEVTFVLIATVVICAVLERRQLALDWKLVLCAVAVFVATVLILWPGAILKLSFVKAYLFMAYLAVFRKAPWGHETLLDTWLQRFTNSPVEWIVIVISIGFFVTNRAIRTKRLLYPFLIFAGLMMVATLRVTTGAPRYALPFMPALQVFAGLVTAAVLARRRKPFAVASATAIAAALFINARIIVNRHPPGADTQLAAVLALIRAEHLESAPLLVPQDYLPTIHYYFPATSLRGYTGDHPTGPELDAGAVTGVLYRADPVRYEPVKIKGKFP